MSQAYRPQWEIVMFQATHFLCHLHFALLTRCNPGEFLTIFLCSSFRQQKVNTQYGWKETNSRNNQNNDTRWLVHGPIRSTVPEPEPNALLLPDVLGFSSVPEKTRNRLRAMPIFQEDIQSDLSKFLGWKVGRSNGGWYFPRRDLSH